MYIKIELFNIWEHMAELKRRFPREVYLKCTGMGKIRTPNLEVCSSVLEPLHYWNAQIYQMDQL